MLTESKRRVDQIAFLFTYHRYFFLPAHIYVLNTKVLYCALELL